MAVTVTFSSSNSTEQQLRPSHPAHHHGGGVRAVVRAKAEDSA
jgi:hypothetical protein